MKILHVLWNGEIGGIERVVYDLSLAQRKLSLEPSWLLSADGGYFLSLAKNARINTTSLDMINGFDARPAICRKAFRVMREVDLIHFHVFNPVLYLIALLTRKPIVYTIHGGFGFGRKLKLNDRAKEFLKTLLLRRATSITANSNFTAEFAAKRYYLPLERLPIVPNGINLNEMTKTQPRKLVRQELGISVDAFCVGTVCRLAGFKRVDRLINAFSIVHKKNENVVMLIIGDGPERQKLKKLAEDNQISQDVHFLGYRQDINNLLSGMDTFVLSSENEPFGISAIEAMAHGLPVFAFSDGGGALESIRQIDHQLIVEDEIKLAEHLLYLAKHPEYRATIQRASTSNAQKFTIEQMATSMHEIYMKSFSG